MRLTRRAWPGGRTALILALLSGGPVGAAAQITAQAGPAFPQGRYALDAGTGVYLAGSLGASLLFVTLQLEASYAHFALGALADGGDREGETLGAGVNLVGRVVPLTGFGPYVLVGGSVGRRRLTDGGGSESGLQPAYQVGAGMDFGVGPIRPFVEVRYVSAGAPGPFRDRYVPIMAGLRMF